MDNWWVALAGVMLAALPAISFIAAIVKGAADLVTALIVVALFSFPFRYVALIVSAIYSAKVVLVVGVLSWVAATWLPELWASGKSSVFVFLLAVLSPTTAFGAWCYFADSED